MSQQREAVLKAIIDAEQEMFCALNTGEDQTTEEKIKPFRLGRWMNFSALSDEFIDSYLLDLLQARKDGCNLMAEKYALMANQVPIPTDDPLIDEIVGVELTWMRELAEKYPHVISQNEEHASLFKKYTFCELQTYSKNSLTLLHHDVMSAKMAGINLAEKRYDNFNSKMGKGFQSDM